MKKQAVMWLAAVMVAVLAVGCGQKKGWQEKHIKGGVVYLLESDEIIQNDTLNGRASLMVGISPKNDTTYSIHFPSKGKQFSYSEGTGIDDYIVINSQKYRLPLLFLFPIWTTAAVPELGLPCGYGINLDKQSTPNLLAIPKIEVSYHHHNAPPIKMTFVAE